MPHVGVEPESEPEPDCQQLMAELIDSLKAKA